MVRDVDDLVVCDDVLGCDVGPLIWVRDDMYVCHDPLTHRYDSVNDHTDPSARVLVIVWSGGFGGLVVAA